MERRKDAKINSFRILKKLSQNYKNILSFAPHKKEIDIQPFNKYLADRKKLFLPKAEKEELKIYKVDDISVLKKSSFFSILEPPSEIKNLLKDLSLLDLAIIPGLSFDKNGNRLGYGMGYFDKLLSRLKKDCHTIGIGFKEQYSEELIPVEFHDIPVDEILLF